MTTHTRNGRRRAAGLLGLTVAMALTAAACGSSSNDTTDTTSGGSTTTGGQTTTTAPKFDYSGLSGTIKATGSSFQDTFDQAVITKFKSVASGLTVTYTKSSSGQGIADMIAGQDDFAGTDRPLKDTETASLAGKTILYFPTVAAPITVSYNLAGVDKTKPIQLDGVTLAKIFSGTVTSWTDPGIAANNSGVSGLTGNIVVCHRQEDSGTTNNFTKYLAKVGGASMTLQAGSNPTNWPAGSIGGMGNGGVANCISGNPGAIGYVDVADAIKANLTYASVKNQAGKFVQPDLDGTQAALAGASSTVKPDLTYDPSDAAGAGAYPITSPTWIIVFKDQPSKARGDAVKGFLNYVLTDGQDQAASAGYGGLPDDIKQKALDQLDQLNIPAT
jgi:phosphate transport system substrate-binding protein